MISRGLIDMNRGRKLSLIVIAISMLFLLTVLTGDEIPYYNITTEHDLQQPLVVTVIDPKIAASIAETGQAQEVSLRTVYELSDAEIAQLEYLGVNFRRRGGQVIHAGRDRRSLLDSIHEGSGPLGREIPRPGEPMARNRNSTSPLRR